MMKKIISLALCLLMLATVLSACGKEVVSSGTTKKVESTKSEETAAAERTLEPKSTEALISKDDVPAADLSNIDTEYQNAAPKAGEEVAVIHTDYGDISFRFFEEVAPMAVANFKALAKAGRYDNTLFHRVTTPETAGISVIQGGDYVNFNGTGGESAFGENFGYEISDYTLNIRGSVAMAHSSLPDSNGSQFYINSANNNALDGDYTVFGQVYDGMDVVDAINAVEAVNQSPVDPVYVNSVEIIEYK